MNIVGHYFNLQLTLSVAGSRIGLLILVILFFWPQPSRGESVRFAHCLAGCPVGIQSENDVIARSIYTLSYNHETRLADWVAYVVTAGSIGVATNLSRELQNEPFIDGALSQQDFSQIAVETSLERHYFAPLISFAGTPYWSDTNFVTNMVPRNSNLNRGPWYGLEWAVRNFANRTEAVYVISGPIFSSGGSTKATSSSIQQSIPSGFFKIVATEDGGLSAFVFDQDVPFHIHHCNQISTLDEIERLTGLSFFPESTDWATKDLRESLGCF